MSIDVEAEPWVRVGAAIRHRRQLAELTLMALAERTDLSQPFLSQVENGRARPSMSSLYRIAQALDTTPQALFGSQDDVADRPVVSTRSGAAAVRATDDIASVVRVLLSGAAPVHLVEYDGLPTEFADYWQHDGFEVAYVVAGEVESDVDGTLSRLVAGDTVSYPAHLPHRHRAVGTTPARLLLIETVADGGGPTITQMGH